MSVTTPDADWTVLDEDHDFEVVHKPSAVFVLQLMEDELGRSKPAMSTDDARRIIDALSKPFDSRQIKQRKIGGRPVDYVGGEAYIARLNHATPLWSMRVTKEEIRDLTVMRWDDATRKRVPTIVPCQIVHGELEIPGVGIRSGIGVQLLEDGAGEDVVKGALTDCLKNCAKYFGLGLHMYSEGAPLIYEDATEMPSDAPQATKPADNASPHPQSEPKDYSGDQAWKDANSRIHAVASNVIDKNSERAHLAIKLIAQKAKHVESHKHLPAEVVNQMADFMENDPKFSGWYDRNIAPLMPKQQQELV